MTGFGDARLEDGRIAVAVEVRTVNNRYLKVITKCPDSFAAHEGEVEKIVRERIGRGTVTVDVRLDRLDQASAAALDQEVLQAYWRQLTSLAKSLHAPAPSDLTSLLVLPGVVADDRECRNDIDADWRLTCEALRQALAKLQELRINEGRSMQDDLRINARLVSERLKDVAGLAPQAVSEYRTKLLERVRQTIAEANVSVTDADVIREVSVFADKCDINEEITRLRCHLDQFEAFLNSTESTGRKLEFLTQEMFREVNTIGAKANHVPIAHAVVDMKAAVEKIKEVLQNVE
jgi:uncharacterized protein (TIGR00255 family)